MLSNGIDTVINTKLPTVEEVLDDINSEVFILRDCKDNRQRMYTRNWGITDHFSEEIRLYFEDDFEDASEVLDEKSTRLEEFNKYIDNLIDFMNGEIGDDEFEPIPIPKEVDDEMQKDSFY